jgi:hypothetical protein
MPQFGAEMHLQTDSFPIIKRYENGMTVESNRSLLEINGLTASGATSGIDDASVAIDLFRALT